MRALLRREEGISLPVTMGVMFVLLVISAAAAAGTVKLTSTSADDRDSKRALAAAEAGIRSAVYRINKLAPTNSLCVTDVLTLPVAGECPVHQEDLGNGASSGTVVTPTLNLTDDCAGLPIATNEDGLVIVQRCVTSTGRVGGVSRRVQARVAAYQGQPLFPVGGILGVDSVKIGNSSSVGGQIGSNGQVTVGNSGSTGDIVLGPSAPAPASGSSTTGDISYRTQSEGPWVLSPVDVGNSATVNDNVRLTSSCGSACDAKTNVTYSSGTRTLSIGNNGSVTLGGGTYNFCDFIATSSATVVVANGAKVRIFIDSPHRSGSGCGAASGNMTVNNNIVFSNPSGDPENLQIYVYGRPNEQTEHVVDFKNSMSMVGTIYAPNSTVLIKNSPLFRGAISAKAVEVKNSLVFSWDDALADLRGRVLTLYYRTAWSECSRTAPVAGDPESGCS